MRKPIFFLLSIGLLAGGGIRAAQETDTYRPTATIKDIMNAMVDPSADYIWDSVSTQISAAGIVERAPRFAQPAPSLSLAMVNSRNFSEILVQVQA